MYICLANTKIQKTMKEIAKDTNLIAYCGLYCGNCRQYKKGKCPGCRENEKMTWCKIRKCCIENNYRSCAACSEFVNVNECKKFNNLIGRVVSFFFKSDRKKSIEYIRASGYDDYMVKMVEERKMAFRK